MNHYPQDAAGMLPCKPSHPAHARAARFLPLAGLLVAGLLLVTGLLSSAGCRKRPVEPTAPDQSQFQTAELAWRDDVFDYAIDTLNRLEEFEGTEMLQQAVNRLDRWVRRQEPLADWTADPFTTKLFTAFTESARGIDDLATALAQSEETDDPEKLRAQLTGLIAQLKDLGKRFDELTELTYLGQFRALAEQMNYLAEQLGGLAAGKGDQPPGDLVEPAQAFIRKVDLSQLDRLKGQLEKFAEAIDLQKLAFSSRDQFVLQEVVWFRNLSRWAAGETLDDPLEPAIRLFDWTVRNIQLDPEPTPTANGGQNRVLQKPWETLLLGRGSVVDRVWVFLLLARQQRIEAVMLAIPDPDDPTGGQARPWAVGVLREGELYLFEPVLGLPIPAPHGIKIEQGRLTIRPATLAQVAADDSLLRQLDRGPQDRYPVESSQVANVIALLETSPDYLAERMQLVESRLTGEEKLVLTTNPTLQAKRIGACPNVGQVRPWRLPYQTLLQEIELGEERLLWRVMALLPFHVGATQQSPLWRARVYHFKGIFTGDPNAVTFYQAARLSNRQMDARQHQLQAIAAESQDPRNAALQQAETRALQLAKINASYWLGLVQAHLGNDRSAVDYFQKRTLAAAPTGHWSHGAIYNLARVYETQGRFDEAIKLYRTDRGSLGYQGNLLRAQWLESLTAGQSEEPDNAATEPQPSPREEMK